MPQKCNLHLEKHATWSRISWAENRPKITQETKSTEESVIGIWNRTLSDVRIKRVGEMRKWEKIDCFHFALTYIRGLRGHREEEEKLYGTSLVSFVGRQRMPLCFMITCSRILVQSDNENEKQTKVIKLLIIFCPVMGLSWLIVWNIVHYLPIYTHYLEWRLRQIELETHNTIELWCLSGTYEYIYLFINILHSFLCISFCEIMRMIMHSKCSFN